MIGTGRVPSLKKKNQNFNKGFYTNNGSPNPPKRKIRRLGQGYLDLTQENQKKDIDHVATAPFQKYMSIEARAPEYQHSSTKFEDIWVRCFYGVLSLGGITSLAAFYTWTKCHVLHKPTRVTPSESHPSPA